METTAEPVNPKLSGLDLVRLSQGFSCIFWGLPVGLLFCVQLLILDVMIADPRIRSSVSHLYFALFCVSLATICFGTFRLGAVKVLGARWTRRARLSTVLAFFSLYFSPFLYWWQAVPYDAFLTVNLFGLILSIVLFLISLNFLSMELGRYLGDNSLRRESKLFLGLNALVLAVPSSSAFAWVTYRGLQGESSLNIGMQFLNLFRLHYPWRLSLFVVLFLPVSLTLANIWRVKEILLDEIKKLPGG